MSYLRVIVFFRSFFIIIFFYFIVYIFFVSVARRVLYVYAYPACLSLFFRMNLLFCVYIFRVYYVRVYVSVCVCVCGYIVRLYGCTCIICTFSVCVSCVRCMHVSHVLRSVIIQASLRTKLSKRVRISARGLRGSRNFDRVAEVFLLRMYVCIFM